ncbi:MAG: response regulator [Ponticaulis sp.]|nr:response regulator [Ponticaulis sp.]|tara:strand:+ start:28280 stop:29077 length:798 start_codon:yes stop_codon:yes gene_type:complete
MSFVEQIGPHLPFLRRYARALTGSQSSGDSYIRASLAALAEAPDQFDDELSPRLALYQFFHAIWSQTGAELEGGEIAPTIDPADKRLQALAPLHRQAFLLTSLEGFTLSEAAIVLNTSNDEVTSLINLAQKEVESELRTKVLIIEDEPIIAADIEQIVEELGHEVTGNATTRDEAVQMASDNPPGLVLCDIQLADNSSGIDAAHDILEKFDVPVIFITAFPERLLTGERPEPTYLISKPFQESTVKAAIGQALFFHPSKADQEAA